MFSKDYWIVFFSRIPRPLKNIYLITVFGFFMWMMFFDKQSILTHIKLSDSINKIHREMDFYRTQIEEINEERSRMDQNTERYVREKYLMAKENEDVFVINRK